jgi:hypothetical protein
MSHWIEQEASDDFNRARFQELLARIVTALNPKSRQLLSLNEVKDVIKPTAETYKGMQAVPVSRILGSEGRYRDFNKSFLPRHEHLRGRWTRVDKAHLMDIVLPPIKLYEIGGMYFVRDGNHRVSVARLQGVEAIDAEVTSLTSEFPLSADMTIEDLGATVLGYERRRFFDQTGFNTIISGYSIRFTEPGRYDEVIQHILGHKYYINQKRSEEISFADATRSWFDTVYMPIVRVLRTENVPARFPRRTEADLYIWIVKHWHYLKEKVGPDVPVRDAVRSYSSRFGKPTLGERLCRFFGIPAGIKKDDTDRR